MHNKMISLALVIITIIAYCSYMVFAYDNRTADNLSAYCTIDFRGIADPQTNKITSATLSVVDFRYGSEQLENFFGVYVNGKTYEINAVEVCTQPPTYSLKDYSTDKFLKYTNTLFITFPPDMLKEIAQTDTVKILFKYTNSDAAIELSLSAVDLQYWKNQLKPL